MDFSDLFNQEEFSDVKLTMKVLTRKRSRDQAEQTSEAGLQQEQQAPPAAPVETEEVQQVLKSIPAHSVILSRSPYFKAQMQQCWQHQGPGSSSGASQERVATIVLDSASHEPACMAVIAAMYGAKTVAAADLHDTQLLQAVLLADMLQVSQIAQQAVEELILKTSPDGMSAELQEALVQLVCWPTCLQMVLPVLGDYGSLSLPVLARTWMAAVGLQADKCLEGVVAAPCSRFMLDKLLFKLRDLQTVWKTPELLQELQDLPLPAMQLLLSSSAVQVPDEDIVLYTVTRYVARQRTSELRQAARKHLAPLIRVPELSNRWLMELLTAADPRHLVLYAVLEPIRCFVALREVHYLSSSVRPSTAPKSWSLGRRSWTSHLAGSQRVWNVEVAQLKQLAVAAYEGRTDKHWGSPTHLPPLQGAGFGLVVGFDGSEAGSCLYAVCWQVPSSRSAAAPVFIDIGYTISVGAHSRIGSGLSGSQLPISSMFQGTTTTGWKDFLGLGPMAGGWDEVAWANKGLPTAGTVDVKLEVSLAEHPYY